MKLIEQTYITTPKRLNYTPFNRLSGVDDPTLDQNHESLIGDLAKRENGVVYRKDDTSKVGNIKSWLRFSWIEN